MTFIPCPFCLLQVIFGHEILDCTSTSTVKSDMLPSHIGSPRSQSKLLLDMTFPVNEPQSLVPNFPQNWRCKIFVRYVRALKDPKTRRGERYEELYIGACGGVTIEFKNLLLVENNKTVSISLDTRAWGTIKSLIVRTNLHGMQRSMLHGLQNFMHSPPRWGRFNTKSGDDDNSKSHTILSFKWFVV